MLDFIFRVYWMGFIVAMILSALVVHLLQEDFNDEGVGIFLVLLITSALCSWYAVFQLLKELVIICRRK